MAFAVQTQDVVDTFDAGELTALVPKMKSFAWSLCRDHAQADDLTQDTLLGAWGARNGYRPGTNLKAWVFRIMRNQFYSDKRRSWRVLQLDPTVAEETLTAVSNPIATLELDDVRRAMLGLSKVQLESLTLIGVHGLNYAQVAQLCGCAEGTIKSRVSRARRTLVDMLAGATLGAGRGVPGEAMVSILSYAGRVPGGGAATNSHHCAHA